MGCLNAISLYRSAVLILNVFPHLSKPNGINSTANKIHAVVMCKFWMPMPFSQGVRTKRTMTEKTLRQNLSGDGN